MLDALFCRIVIVTDAGSYAVELVRGDGYAYAAATDENAALRIAGENVVRHEMSEIRVVVGFARLMSSNIGYFVALLLQMLDNELLHLVAGVVGSYDDFHSRFLAYRKRGLSESGTRSVSSSAGIYVQRELIGFDHRCIDNMLGDKPDLKLVDANDIADDQVVGAIVTALRGFLRELTSFFENDLVASSRREIWTGTSSRSMGGRSRRVCSATS